MHSHGGLRNAERGSADGVAPGCPRRQAYLADVPLGTALLSLHPDLQGAFQHMALTVKCLRVYATSCTQIPVQSQPAILSGDSSIGHRTCYVQLHTISWGIAINSDHDHC